MTKKEFIEQVAASSGLSKADAARAVDSILDTISVSLRKGEEVNLTGFGKFTVTERGARRGVNPQTGQRIQIEASKAPRFRPGGRLKRATSFGDGDEDF